MRSCFLTGAHGEDDTIGYQREWIEEELVAWCSWVGDIHRSGQRHDLRTGRSLSVTCRGEVSVCIDTTLVDWRLSA